jgi:tetratricopeptide (TPR) repeat protein
MMKTPFAFILIAPLLATASADHVQDLKAKRGLASVQFLGSVRSRNIPKTLKAARVAVRAEERFEERKGKRVVHGNPDDRTYIIDAQGRSRLMTPEERATAFAHSQQPYLMADIGTKQMRRGEYRQAEESLEMAAIMHLQQMPNYVPAEFLIRLSQAYWLQGKPQQAWQAVCTISEDDLRFNQKARNAFNYILVRRGYQSAQIGVEALADRKKYDGGVLGEFRAYSASVRDVKIVTALAMTSDIQGAGDDEVIAVPYYREILELEPNNAVALFCLAPLLVKKGENANAIIAYERAAIHLRDPDFKNECRRRIDWIRRNRG